MWVDRDKRPPLTDSIGVLAGAVTAAAEELVNVDAAPQNEQLATFTANALIATAVNTIVDSLNQSDGLGVLAGAMVPAAQFTIVDAAGQSETIAVLGGSITPANEFVLVEPAAQSDGLSTFAGAITPAASQP